MATTHFLSMSLKNQFSFHCPVVDVDVEMRGCVYLRDKVYSGQTIATRRGCQACIQASKCPAAEMVRRVAFGSNDATDHCASEEPKLGRIPGDVLDRIKAVLVPEHLLRQYGVSSAEVAKIQSSRERIEAQALTAPRTKVEGRERRVAAGAPARRESRVIEMPKTAPEVSNAITNAAATGNMAAAINAA